jgi:hypothetical protein
MSLTNPAAQSAISFPLHQTVNIRVKIFDATGRLVKTFADLFFLKMKSIPSGGYNRDKKKECTPCKLRHSTI